MERSGETERRRPTLPRVPSLRSGSHAPANSSRIACTSAFGVSDDVGLYRFLCGTLSPCETGISQLVERPVESAEEAENVVAGESKELRWIRVIVAARLTERLDDKLALVSRH